MKKFTLLLSMLLCLVLFAGCKASAIEGTWVEADGTTYTFNKDMTFAINATPEIVVGGTFSIVKDSNKKDTNLIVFTLNVPSGQPITSQATFTLDSKTNTLTFTGSDGKTTVLKKK